MVPLLPEQPAELAGRSLEVAKAARLGGGFDEHACGGNAKQVERHQQGTTAADRGDGQRAQQTALPPLPNHARDLRPGEACRAVAGSHPQPWTPSQGI